jgi:phosphatidylinositol alpha 1,6-mannosyltransferase
MQHIDRPMQQSTELRSPGAERRPLRVAIVASSYNYIRDGVALTLNRLVEYLERHGVEVLVFAPVGEVAAFPYHGTVVPVPSIPLPRRAEYRLAFALPRARLEAFRPDLMHIALAPDILGFTAWRAAKRLRIPLVASYHTRYETYLKHYWYVAGLEGLLKRYLNYVYASCREVYVPSQSMIDTLLADGLKDNFRLWHRGVDPQQFDPTKRSGTWRAGHGIGEDELVVLQVSRLVREKQLDTLTATLRLLASRGIAHRCVIVGDGPERAALERDLPDAIFTGFLEGEALSAAYASSDIFLFPSETESFGNVTLEAMASGLPCVCADATGSRSLVVNGLTGFLARPRHAEDFAEHVATLAGDPDLRRRMSSAARAQSLAFSWDATMGRLLGSYTALLRETPT